ncbi:broad substrate specificity ATP-binding cassette transporter ABCG2-like [Acipenser oxyrinchus oxyrinchus]|uniref:Broad substrate specificity ATP-binding cassette transporter ABCG2-like n=1 Tax=Acipenser oxyrinchus oxyrinchus TaxID=40147 RepID=A0AAD8G1X2_ACIOX|nr:broad substrate specificity ATP-binding cassette transporter ABCG2-like [Acipenser oxyrinchus oxyrinchus]
MEAEEATIHFQMPGPTLTFQNVRYFVNLKRKFLHRNAEEKEILKDISGIMKPGMNAILGPTGSGKTSLLDVIAGRKDPKGLRTGQVLVDSEIVNADMRMRSAYVVQDDILMGTLTVRENLEFSANLRLSRIEFSAEDKKLKVNAVIRELSLQDCADTKIVFSLFSKHIGTDFIRGISGGERKRCSIGMELITSPSLIFLDEPTTGLDANTANSLMRLLHTISRKGKTVIFSIHQPRYSIFQQFDHMTLMNKGEIIFAGAPDKALGYFEKAGYKCEAFNNPADFFLDIINGEIPPTLDTPTPGLQTNALVSCEDKNKLAFYYRQSEFYSEVEETLRKRPCSSVPKQHGFRDKDVYATPFFYQLLIVSLRTMKNILRNPQTSYAQLALNIFFGVLVGLIYYQIPNTLPEAIQNRVGAFFFLVINMVFGNLSAVELFINERVLFIHENTSGYYRTSTYFLSKVFADLIPNRIFPVFLFSAVSYFMMGMKNEVEAFFLYAFTLSMVSMAAVSLAFLVSASVRTFAVANVLIALPYVFMMVFGGFLVNLNAMLNWMSWLKWISIFRYGLNALTINEMKGQLFYSNTSTTTGEEYMDQQGIDYSPWAFWQNEVALISISCVCMVFAYIQLWRVNRWK